MKNKPRKLKLASGVWRYKVSGSKVALWTPGGRRIELSRNTVGRSVCGCYPYNCYSSLGVTPGSLKQYIENNFL